MGRNDAHGPVHRKDGVRLTSHPPLPVFAITATGGDGIIRWTKVDGGGGPRAPVDGGRTTRTMGAMSGEGTGADISATIGEGTVSRTMGPRTAVVVGGRTSGTGAASSKIGEGTDEGRSPRIDITRIAATVGPRQRVSKAQKPRNRKGERRLIILARGGGGRIRTVIARRLG